MRVKVTLSETDMQKGIRRLYAKLGYKALWLSIVAVIAASTINGALQTLLNKQAIYKILDQGVHQFISVLLFMLLWYLIYRFLIRYSPVQYYHTDGMFRRPREIYIDPAGVHQNTQYDSSLTRWEGIMRVEEDAEFVMLYVDTASAFMIPKYFFSTPAEAAAFAAQARDYRDSALKTLEGATPAAAPSPHESATI